MDLELFKTMLSYDHESGKFFWRGENCYSRVRGKTAGAVSKVKSGKKYIKIAIRGEVFLAHRLAWFFNYGEFPAGQIDHINGDGTDNRILNLRVVSPSENMKNQKLRSTNKSGRCGVSFCNQRGLWVASITVDRKSILLGRFSEKSDAIKARVDAEKKYNFHENHGTIRSI